MGSRLKCILSLGTYRGRKYSADPLFPAPSGHGLPCRFGRRILEHMTDETDAPKPSPRLPRFSLRSLILAVLLAGSGYGLG